MTHLFDGGCLGADQPNAGIQHVGAQGRIGSLLLPAVGPDGSEFHLFQVASALGGNAVGGSDYWVVVVRQNDVWATTKPFASAAEIRNATLTGNTLLLEDPATTTKTGAGYTVAFGQVAVTSLPMLPSSALSTTTQVLVGELTGPFHATNWRPALQVGKALVVIDEDGTCPSQALQNAGARVSMTAEVTKWSDGRSRVRCVALTTAP